MANLDRLASLSKRMKETTVVVSSGGGQEGTQSVTGPVESVPVSGQQFHAQAPAAASASKIDAGAPASPEVLAALHGIRDAVLGLTSEVRLLRMERDSGVSGQLDHLREQIQTQGVQLAESLRLLRAKSGN